MKTNWLILLSFAVVQPFMLYGAEITDISAASSGALVTIAQTPFNKEQINALAQQAVANCITSQTRKYKATLQQKLSILQTFRSKMQPESLRDKRAGLIIHQQNLHLGCIQADRNDDTDASPSSASNKWWSQLFKNKLLTESTDEQAEILWAHETASLLVQYWLTYAAYKSQKKHTRIESLIDNVANNVATDPQPPATIAKVSLTQDQITTLAQQAIANCMTPQTRRYKDTLQKKLAALLAFRSKTQPESLRSQNAGLIIKQQTLDRGNIQAYQHTDITASSSISNRQSWGALFRNKLLIKSAGEQEEIAWAHKTASLLVQYWPIYNTYVAQKKRERTTRKREQPDDSVKETQKLLRKNRRRNDSPIPFVPVADEQISVSTFSELMHSNDNAHDATLFPEIDTSSMVYFDLPTSAIETYDFSWMEEHDEN